MSVFTLNSMLEDEPIAAPGYYMCIGVVVFSGSAQANKALSIDTDKFSTLRSVTISELSNPHDSCVNRCHHPRFSHTVRFGSRRPIP
jgi:hypothetical protein